MCDNSVRNVLELLRSGKKHIANLPQAEVAKLRDSTKAITEYCKIYKARHKAAAADDAFKKANARTLEKVNNLSRLLSAK